MIEPIQYILFCKTHSLALSQNYNSYVQEDTTLTSGEKKVLIKLSDDVIAFITSQKEPMTMLDFEQNIETFLHLYFDTLSHRLLTLFIATFEKAHLRLLLFEKHSQLESLYLFLNSMAQFIHVQYFKHFPLNKDALNEQTELMKLENLMSALILAPGPESLPELLIILKESFQFKRCIFYEYIPWKNEFRGVAGADIQIVQQISGKRDFTKQFFSFDKPIYLQTPHPFLPSELIQAHQLSSMIFVPVRHNGQIYGWLELDQVGEPFQYDQKVMNALAKAGSMLALLFAREPTFTKMYNPLDLTEKEKVVLLLISDGYSNKEIAETLFMSEFTIRDYVQRLLMKLEAKNRTHLIKKGFELGYI